MQITAIYPEHLDSLVVRPYLTVALRTGSDAYLLCRERGRR